MVDAIDPSNYVSATELDEALGFGVTRVYNELRCLEQAGLLRVVDSERATTDFQVVDSEAWSALKALATAADRLAPGVG